MAAVKRSARTAKLKALFVVFSLMLAASFIPGSALGNFDTGTIWTTDQQQPPQDKNIYRCNETVFLTGDFFTSLERHETERIYYEILKLPVTTVKRSSIPFAPKVGRDFEGVPILAPAEYAPFLDGVPNEYQVSAYYASDFITHKIASDNFKLQCPDEVDAFEVQITPELATNPVGEAHTFTVSVLKNGIPAPAGTAVNLEISSPGFFTRIGSQTIAGTDTRSGAGTVDGTGKLTVEVNSSMSGDSTLRAWIDKEANAAFDLGEPTDTSKKIWVEEQTVFAIDVEPPSAINMTGEEHVFTVTVLMNGQPAASGAKVNLSITTPGFFTEISGQRISAAEVRSGIGTVQSDGKFSVKVNSTEAGTSFLRAWIDQDADGVWGRNEPFDTACKAWMGLNHVSKIFKLHAVGAVPQGTTLWAAWGPSADDLSQRVELEAGEDGSFTATVSLLKGSTIWWNFLKIEGSKETPLLPSALTEILPLTSVFVNQAVVEFPVPPPAVQLNITKRADPQEVRKGKTQPLAYTIVVSNLSTTAVAKEVQVKDNDFPSFFSMSEVLVDGQAASGALLATGLPLGDLDPTSSRTVVVKGTASPTELGEFQNVAFAFAKNAPPVSAPALVVVDVSDSSPTTSTTTSTVPFSGSSATTTTTSPAPSTTVPATTSASPPVTTATAAATAPAAPTAAVMAAQALPAQVSITKRVSAALAVPSGRLTYRIDVRNSGPKPLTNVQLGDRMPAGANYIWGTGSVGAKFLSAERGLLWKFGTLRPGESRIASFQVKIAASAPSLMENVAVVDTAETPPAAASARTVILRQPKVVTFERPRMPMTK